MSQVQTIEESPELVARSIQLTKGSKHNKLRDRRDLCQPPEPLLKLPATVLNEVSPPVDAGQGPLWRWLQTCQLVCANLLAQLQAEEILTA